MRALIVTFQYFPITVDCGLLCMKTCMPARGDETYQRQRKRGLDKIETTFTICQDRHSVQIWWGAVQQPHTKEDEELRQNVGDSAFHRVDRFALFPWFKSNSIPHTLPVSPSYHTYHSSDNKLLCSKSSNHPSAALLHCCSANCTLCATAAQALQSFCTEAPCHHCHRNFTPHAFPLHPAPLSPPPTHCDVKIFRMLLRRCGIVEPKNFSG